MAREFGLSYSLCSGLSDYVIADISGIYKTAVVNSIFISTVSAIVPRLYYSTVSGSAATDFYKLSLDALDNEMLKEIVEIPANNSVRMAVNNTTEVNLTVKWTGYN